MNALAIARIGENKSAPAKCFNPNKGDVRKALPEAGEGLREPPYLLWLWSQFLLKNHVPPKELFFHGSPKKWQKLKIY